MYRLTPEINKTIIKVIESGTMFIPMDENNTDYQAYLAWLAEGNEPEPAEEQT